MEKRSILYVHSSASSYGSDNALYDMIAQLDRQRFRTIVAVPENGPLIPRLKAIGAAVVVLPLAVIHRRKSPFFWLAFVWRLASSAIFLLRLIRSERIALVHSNTSHVLSGAFAAFFAGIPHLWQIREIALWKTIIARPMKFFVSCTTIRIVCVSDTVRSIFNPRGNLADRTRVVFDGIEVDKFLSAGRIGEFRSSLGFKPDQQLVGLVGRIVNWKGQLQFIEAAAMLHKTHPLARFVIVGEALTKNDQIFVSKLKRLIEEKGLSQVVIFAGLRNDIPKVMADLDILTLLSLTPEAWGLVVLEAMAAATAVISFRHGGVMDTVAEGETGFLVEVNNIDALSRSIAFLLDSPERCAAMGQAGRKRVLEYFQAKDTGVAFMALYDEILAETV